MNGARTAASKISTNNTKPNVASLLPKKACRKRLNGVSAAVIFLNISALRLRQAHARIKQRIQQVDTQIEPDEDNHNQGQESHDYWPVKDPDRIDQELAHTGPGKNRFGHDRESDDGTKLQRHHGDDRDQDIFEHMH